MEAESVSLLVLVKIITIANRFSNRNIKSRNRIRVEWFKAIVYKS